MSQHAAVRTGARRAAGVTGPCAPSRALGVLVFAALVASTGLTAAPAQAAVTTKTFSSQADSQVEKKYANKNYGGSSSVTAAGSPVVETYVRFAPSGVQGTVTKAVLRLHVHDGSADGPTVYSTGNSWTETGVTWNNRPARTGSALADAAHVDAMTWLQYDVTRAVSGDGTYSFNLATTSSDSTGMYARESGSTSLRPQLVLTVDDGASSAVTAGDTTPPETTITSGPSATTDSPSASFSFTSSESGSTFACRLDTAAFAPCQSPATYSGLADGSHTFQVQATDAAGNLDASPAVRTWTVATVNATSTTGSKLSWAPPQLTSPVTYRVSGDGPGTIAAAPGQDSIVVWDAPTHRRLRMTGGRHWVIRGGEVNNDKQWTNLGDQSGLQFENLTGTAFVEGMYIHGAHGKDGIRVGSGGSNATLVVQNTRILQRMSGPTAYHADVIQAYGGVKALRVDRLTGSGDFQGQMWKQETGTTFGPTDFRRVNYRAAIPEVAYMVNLVMSSPTQPVTLSEVYSEPDPSFVSGDFCRAQSPVTGSTCRTDADGRKYVTWSGTPITVSGRVTQGPPPGGDFAPAGVPGLRYASPGYL